MAEIVVDAEANTAMSGGRALVFHCHHYNATLQRTIEDAMGAQAYELLALASKEAVRQQLMALSDDHSPEALCELAAELFKTQGFGTLEMGELTRTGGRVTCPSSHYALGWLAKFGKRETPACEFVAGFVAGTTVASFGVEPERVRVVESACQAMGAPACLFDVEVY